MCITNVSIFIFIYIYIFSEISQIVSFFSRSAVCFAMPKTAIAFRTSSSWQRPARIARRAGRSEIGRGRAAASGKHLENVLQTGCHGNIQIARASLPVEMHVDGEDLLCDNS